jgi:hypothetical protein
MYFYNNYSTRDMFIHLSQMPTFLALASMAATTPCTSLTCMCASITSPMLTPSSSRPNVCTAASFRVSYAYIVLRVIYVRSTAAAMHRGRCTWLCRNLKSTQPLLMAIVYSRTVHPRASCMSEAKIASESSFSTMDSRYEGPC